MAMDTQKENGTRNEGQNNARDMFETWQGYYQQWADESMEMFNRGMETAQKMSPFFPGPEMARVWMDNYKEFMDRFASEGMGSASSGADTYRKAYDVWLDYWTKNMEAFIQTPEFAEKSGQHLGMMSDMKQRFGEFMESYWHAMHLPSSHDMREIYHKLYIIERKLDEMDRRFREAETGSVSGAGAKKTKN